MTDDPFARWHLTPVINASGTMTRIGASRVPRDVRACVDRILASFVDMDELQSRAGSVIARVTGAQAGCIASCSAAAMTQTVAACLTGADLARIEALPWAAGERRVLLPMGHMVNYGAPIDQAIRLAGAEVVPVGTAAACETWHLADALAAGAAAAMYVVSHHTVRENELPMDVFINLCREHGVPAIVDMASEHDLTGPIELGASAVIHSGHKFLSGVTSAVVAGSSDLIRGHLSSAPRNRTDDESRQGECRRRHGGARVVEERDHDAVRRAEETRVAHWMRELADMPGVCVTTHADWTGNPITRLRITIAPRNSGFHAWELAARLAARTPGIVVRDDLVERQELYLDPCNLTDAEAAAVAVAIREEVERFLARGDGRRQSWSDVKLAREAAILSWSGNRDGAL